MAALTGNKIKDSYLGLLKTTNSGILTSSFVRITDGGGNNTQLYLSNTAIRFYDAYTFPSADGTVSGQVLTTDANGALSWADSSDNQTLDEVLTQGNTTNLAILSSANGNTFGSTTFTGVATLANNSVVTGTPPTASDNSTKIATTAYVDNQVSTGGTVKKTGTITQNAIAVWNNTSDTLRSDFSVSVSTDGTITLYQPNNVPSDIKNYNIGGGNIALNTGGFNTGFGEGNLSQVGFLGSNNSAFGYKSSFAMTTGDNNTSVGFSSLLSETVGDNNTAIGHYSLFYSNNGNYNTAIGSYSLYTNSLGGQNVALGYEALRNNTTSSHNAALGYRALKLSTGDHNLGVGYNSGSAIVTGNNNVVIGSNTGSTIDGLSNRIIISDGAANIRQLIDNLGKLQMPSYGSASPHTGTLAKTLAVDSSGYVIEVDATTGTVTSVALSVPTGLTVTNSPITTSGTITIGGTLGVANGGTGATTLTGILLGNGTSAISAVTDGTVGQVLSTNGSGTYSFIDAGTGDVTVDGASVGNRVAVWNNTTGELRGTSAIATENSNIYLVQPSTNGTDKFNYIIGGAFAINENDFGIQNTGFGEGVFNGADFTGNSNTAFGSQSQYVITTGASNTSVGFHSMYDNRSGSSNVGLGARTMFNQRISNYNVAIGYDSMDGVTASQTAVSDYNTAVGYQSLQSIQGGDNNTVIGKDSGNAITTGSNNVIIGSNTGSTIATSSNNIIISDGSGNIRQSFDINGAATFSGNVTANQIFSTTTAAGYAATLTNTNGASDSNGLLVKAGSTASEYVVRFANKTDTSTFFTVKGTGAATFSSPNTTANVAMVTIRSTDSQGANVGGTLGLGGSYGAGLVNYALIRGAKENSTNNDSNGYMSFTVHSSAGEVERMRITSGGNVGIGEDDPNWMLEVKKDSSLSTAGTYPAIIVNNPNAAGYSAFYLFNDAQNVGGLEYNNTTNILSLNSLEGNPISIPNGISSGGTVVVGAAVDSAALSSFVSGLNGVGAKVSNNGYFNFTGINASDSRTFYVLGTGAIHSTSTSITQITSDVNLKTEITDYTKGLSEVLLMKPRYYKYKSNLEELKVGFIAQEMEEALSGSMIDSSEINKTTGEKYKTYQLEWYPLLVKAIQEQQTIIEDLKLRIEKLEG
jgi:trimeric autotransporter adhesin